MIQIVAKTHKKKLLKEVGLESDFGKQYYCSNDLRFLEEVRKFECPVRFANFLALNQFKFEILPKDLYVKSSRDIILDFSQRQIEYLHDELFNLVLENKSNEFIEKTPEYNRYGKVGF